MKLVGTSTLIHVLPPSRVKLTVESQRSTLNDDVTRRLCRAVGVAVAAEVNGVLVDREDGTIDGLAAGVDLSPSVAAIGGGLTEAIVADSVAEIASRKATAQSRPSPTRRVICASVWDSWGSRRASRVGPAGWPWQIARRLAGS